MTAVAELPVASGAEPDLIDRIAEALPEDIRAEYYRELLHCRSLPEDDEMLRLLRAMQFLVLLIEQAPSRVAEERGRLEALLGTQIDKISKATAATESYYSALQKRLTGLPDDVAKGISPAAVAEKINENLQQIFMRSTIPNTARVLEEVAGQMKVTGLEFSKASDQIGHTYRGAAEEARNAVATLKQEISQAETVAKRFTKEIAEKSSALYGRTVVLIATGAFVIGVAMGMEFERWLFPPPGPVAQQSAQPVPVPPEAVPLPPQPAGKSSAATKGGKKN